MPETDSNSPSATPSGIIVTLLLVAFILVTGMLWYLHRPGDNNVTAQALQRNELRTYENLKRIGRAQDQYRTRSSKLNGKTEFAGFVTHLWTAVDSSGNPVPLDLINKELALAIGPTKSHHGYYFIDVRQRLKHADRKMRSLDYRSRWAIAAIPRQAGRTGSLVFLADETGAVFAKPMREFSSQYPLDPAADGWQPLPTAAALVAYQENVVYTLVSN
jgi:hypothetical protein